MNILIVGGTGVISHAVVKEAIKCGYDVTCINRGKSKTQKLPEQVKVFISDYRDKTKIKKFLNDKYYDAILDVLCYTEQDIEYSVDLFKDKCNQYIFFSSCAVYNKGNGDYECNEDSELINPLWKYSVDKVNCEKKLIALAHKYSFNYTIVRPAVTYGNTRIPYGISPQYGYHGTIIQRLLNNKPIILWDKGEAYSTITRVEDFAIGFVGLLGNTQAFNQAIHIVGDERHKWKTIIDELADILGVTPVYCNISKEDYAKEIPSRKGEILGGRGISQLLDNSKLKSMVPGFKTTIPLRRGLEMTVDYYKTNNWLSGIDWRFDAETDRIVKKYFGSIDYNVGFCDYLGNASLRDRYVYITEFNKDNVIVKSISLFVKIIKKFNRLFRKCIQAIRP